MALLSRHLRRSEQAFTLVELLIVILIIAILAATAVAAFLAQQGKARDSSAQQSLQTAFKSAKSESVFRDGRFVTGSCDESCLAGAIEVSEPGLGDVGTRASINGMPAGRIFVIEPATSADALQLAMKTTDGPTWSLTVIGNGPPQVVQASAETYAQMILADMPAAYWPLQETSGTFADDVAGGADGTYGGSVIFGQPGPLSEEGSVAARFNATVGSHLSTPLQPYASGTSRTFEAWVLRTNTATGSIFGSVGGLQAIQLAGAGGVLFYPWVGQDTRTWSGAVPAGSWVLLDLVFEEAADRVELFINGASQGAFTGFSQGYGANSAMNLGQYASNQQVFNGRMAHVAVYNRALIPAEIQDHYAAR